MVKMQKVMRYRRFITQVANFYSLQTVLFSFWQRKRLAMQRIFFRILVRFGFFSDGCSLCSRCSLCVGEQVMRSYIISESGVGAQCIFFRFRKLMQSRLLLVVGGLVIAFIFTLVRLQRRCLCWQAGRILFFFGFFMRRNYVYQFKRMILV